MRKLIYIVSVGVLMTLAACGTAGKQARKKQAEPEQVSLSLEERRKFDYFFLEAVRMKEKGQYDAAYELYKHCLDINPASGAALYEISQFYMYLGQEAKGEEALKQAIRSDKSNFWYKQTLASYYEQKRNMPKAISVYENMAEQFPSRLEPLMSLVDLYNRTKSYQNVITVLNRLEELDGKSEQISMEKFRMYLLMGKQDSAFIEIENLSKEYPYDLRYQNILGDVYLNNGKYPEALATYQHILKEEPHYAPAVLSMASYYQKTGQDSLYQLQLDTILMNDNVLSDTKMELMRQNILQSEQTTKDSTQIVALFKRILARPQQNADLAMLCAQYMITKNMKEESVPVLEQVLSLDPENKPAYLQLLSYAIQDNDLDKVIQIATSALEYHPDALEFYYYCGIAHYQKEETDKALEVFTRGVRQINEKSDKQIASDFYAILGDIYHQKGRAEESYAAYDSSLVYNPDNIGTLNNYAYFLSIDKKQLDKAEEMSYRTVKAEPENKTYLDTYAWILFEKGRYTEARIYIEQALRNGGDKSRVIVEHCGDIYYMLGEKDKALEYWEKADAMKETEEGETPPTEEEIKRLKQKIKLKKYIE
ncbi:Tetratricopeptide TPR_2 repeat-containing protein [Phocaeicola salanitronis DSM 18170]|uniref:Tetratricopeptide TPR_2 repeat-containing protein n=1 Tax=Phocaeicola salanitronis (strain DSM 18170 / JCM 13657 / CCUG 60908 / BL78) TaxID=667015 RepID=F0R2E7_PHOSB|nr:tetratricopeptide repeat protein [Phocaeicola salanitronis]ADY36476.1 Tetratricopeptide TPR_2 repeat-containing protein [Phocaeicola salanitronis DSM 18170]